MMKWRAKIAVAAGVLLLAGCRELPRYFASDTTIARAGGKELRMGDVRSVVPRGLSGEDSAAFMQVYVDRWIVKQLKLEEAEDALLLVGGRYRQDGRGVPPGAADPPVGPALR